MGARLLEEELESSHICALSGRPFGGPLSLRLDIVNEALRDGIMQRVGEMWLCGEVVGRKKEVLAWLDNLRTSREHHLRVNLNFC